MFLYQIKRSKCTPGYSHFKPAAVLTLNLTAANNFVNAAIDKWQMPAAENLTTQNPGGTFFLKIIQTKFYAGMRGNYNTGIDIVKLLPWPGVLSISNSAFIFSSNWRTRKRPRPLPFSPAVPFVLSFRLIKIC